MAIKTDFKKSSPRQRKQTRLSGQFAPVAEMETPNLPYKDKDWTVFTEGLKHRRLYIHGEVDDDMAAKVIAALHMLEERDPKKPIHLIINTPGGVCTDGFAIIDAITLCQAPVHGYVYGLAASMGSLIIAACDKRYATPNAEIMIHEPQGYMDGKATDIDGAARDMIAIRNKIIKIYVRQTGIKLQKIRPLIEYDNTLTPNEAKDMGLIHEVLTQEEHFRIMHGRKVPKHKLPPFPEPTDKELATLGNADQRFRTIINDAIRSRKKTSNDNATPKRTVKKTPRKPR